MPLYEYECEADGRRFEVIQKFSDPPVTACPTCGGAVRKLLSSPAIQFKGSGWYITDYARKSGADAGKDTKSGSSGSGTGGDSGSGSKAESSSSSSSSSSSTSDSAPLKAKETKE